MIQKDRTAHDVEQTQPEANRVVEQMVMGTRWITRTQLYHQHAWKPPTDVIESEEEIMVIVEVPGMQEEDFSIMFADGVLTINGTRPSPESVSHCVYQQMEICYGEFISQVHIPWAVDTDHVEARYGTGFLTISLPRTNRVARRVPVIIAGKQGHREE